MSMPVFLRSALPVWPPFLLQSKCLLTYVQTTSVLCVSSVPSTEAIALPPAHAHAHTAVSWDTVAPTHKLYFSLKQKKILLAIILYH